MNYKSLILGLLLLTIFFSLTLITKAENTRDPIQGQFVKVDGLQNPNGKWAVLSETLLVKTRIVRVNPQAQLEIVTLDISTNIGITQTQILTTTGIQNVYHIIPAEISICPTKNGWKLISTFNTLVAEYHVTSTGSAQNLQMYFPEDGKNFVASSFIGQGCSTVLTVIQDYVMEELEVQKLGENQVYDILPTIERENIHLQTYNDKVFLAYQTGFKSYGINELGNIEVLPNTSGSMEVPTSNVYATNWNTIVFLQRTNQQTHVMQWNPADVATTELLAFQNYTSDIGVPTNSEGPWFTALGEAVLPPKGVIYQKSLQKVVDLKSQLPHLYEVDFFDTFTLNGKFYLNAEGTDLKSGQYGILVIDEDALQSNVTKQFLPIILRP